MGLQNHAFIGPPRVAYPASTPSAGAAAELERRRPRWGFTSFTTFARSAEALAKVKSEFA
jgi:hypothetical protein